MVSMESLVEVRLSPQQRLEQTTGIPWVGIRFLKHLPAGHDGGPSNAMRFCEAVFQARRDCITLRPETVCCYGAKRAFGWMKNRDRELATQLAEKGGMTVERAEELVRRVPVLGYPYVGIGVGPFTNPDVLVAYVRPEAAMRLVRLWETTMGRSLRVDVSSIMAVCGSAVVGAYMDQAISISLGCPDSRRYGGIQSDEMVIAVPAGLLDKFRGILDTVSLRSAE